MSDWPALDSDRTVNVIHFGSSAVPPRIPPGVTREQLQAAIRRLIRR